MITSVAIPSFRVRISINNIRVVVSDSAICLCFRICLINREIKEVYSRMFTLKLSCC